MEWTYFCLGWTPLMRAVWQRKEKLVQLLLENGAHVNHELRSGQRWSALYIGMCGTNGCIAPSGARINQ